MENESKPESEKKKPINEKAAETASGEAEKPAEEKKPVPAKEEKPGEAKVKGKEEEQEEALKAEQAAIKEKEVKKEKKAAPEKKKKPEKKVEDNKEEGKEEEKKPKSRKKEKAQESEGKWYVIQTLTGHEDRVKRSLERNIKGSELEDKVFNILIPEEDTVEIRKGKRVEKKKKMFPGYIFIEMSLNEESWYAIRQTPGVAKFIGNKIRPIPVVDREMQRVLKQLGVREEKIEIAFEKGETVRIIGGPFRGYTGTVEEVNIPKEKVKALVNIFGRDTPVEIDFEQAEKVV